MMHETGLFIAGGAETTRTAIAPRPRRARRAPRPVGGGGRRSGAGAGPGRGGHPLGHAAQQHVPPGAARRPDRRPAGARRRPGHAGLPVGQPRRGRVRRAFPLRHPPRPQPARRLRAGHPLLPRRQPRPPRAAAAVRCADRAVDEPARRSRRPTSSRTSSPAPSGASTWRSTCADRGPMSRRGLPSTRRSGGRRLRRPGRCRRPCARTSCGRRGGCAAARCRGSAPTHRSTA